MKRRIRSAQRPDARAIRDIYAPFVTDSATSFETDAPDVATMEERILALRGQYPWLVFESDGVVRGYAYASSHRTRKAYQWCVEVSAYVHADARGRGVGRALYASLLEILRRQGYVNAYAAITLPNPASVAFHESMGFAPIGVYPRIGFKLGRWHDTGWYQLRLGDPEAPVDPRPLAPVLAEPDVVAMFETYARSPALG